MARMVPSVPCKKCGNDNFRTTLVKGIQGQICRVCAAAYAVTYRRKLRGQRLDLRYMVDNYMDGIKPCITCGSTNFYTYSRPNHKHNRRCRECQNQRTRTWRKTKPFVSQAGKRSLIPKETIRKYRLRAAHGLTVKEYDSMIVNQNNACAICHTPFDVSGVFSPCVDHDHITGLIRGLLCSHCNLGIGLFEDSPTLLRFAAKYITKHTQKED